MGLVEHCATAFGRNDSGVIVDLNSKAKHVQLQFTARLTRSACRKQRMDCEEEESLLREEVHQARLDLSAPSTSRSTSIKPISAYRAPSVLAERESANSAALNQ
jgi:hypothetical protein